MRQFSRDASTATSTFAKMYYIFYIAIFLMAVFVSDAARILVFVPTPSISHQVVFRPIVQELAKRGHDVVIMTTDPVFPKGKSPGNLTEINMHDFSYKMWEHFVSTSSTGDNNVRNQVKTAFKLLEEIFIQQIQLPEVQEVINDKSKPFDLLVLEAVVTPTLILTEILKAPAIQISSLAGSLVNYETVGVPGHPLLYPQFFRKRIYNLTFWEKLEELYNYYQFVEIFRSCEVAQNKLLRDLFGPDTPRIKELMNNVDMLFVNINSIWEGNFPVPPGVVYMGGLHQMSKKELPKDLQTYLDSSKHGVIYMSFGTNVSPSQLPTEVIQIFLKVFSKLPYDILWKWDRDELPGRSPNVRISKWLPQSDLLRHPNVKLFITQGGLQSTDEAITAGVPLIGIPILGDQWYNTEKYPHHGIGAKIDLNDLTEERLNNDINKIIGDKSYKENIKRLHVLMTDQPMKPLDRAIWWIEYVLRHKGAKHLRSPAANITWAEYLELEFLGTLLLLVLGVIVFIYVTLRCLIKFVRSLTGVKTKTS